MSDLKETAIARIATLTGIDATTVAITEMYIVPVGKILIPLFVVIHVTSFTAGGKAVQAVASFGGNSATYDDFLNTVTYTVANGAYAQRDAPADATEYTVQVAGSSFRISIETASDATTEVWTAHLFGLLVDA
jgi:hypothetical protein